MKSTVRFGAVVFLGAIVLGWSVPAVADNKTQAGAYFLPANGFSISSFVYGAGGTPPERWYFAKLRANRSYAFTAIPYSNSVESDVYTNITVYAADGTTLLGTNNDSSIHAPEMWAYDPVGGSYFGGSRETYVSATDQNVLIKVTAQGLAAAAYTYYRISVQETTLLCPWYYTSSAYESYVQITNSSSNSRSVTVTFRAYNSSTVTGSHTVSVPALGALFVAAKSDAGVAAGQMGSITITHNAHPGAIKANMTAVNGTGVGLTHSFNVPFASQIQGEVAIGQ